jgi:hypothetical protein
MLPLLKTGVSQNVLHWRRISPSKKWHFLLQQTNPNDVLAQYASTRVVFSLKTQSRVAALKSAASVTGQLEKQWLHFKSEQWPIPVLSHLAKPNIETCTLELQGVSNIGQD